MTKEAESKASLDSPARRKAQRQKLIESLKKSNKPIVSNFNCRENKYKFCLPLGQPSARELEDSFEQQRLARVARQKSRDKKK